MFYPLQFWEDLQHGHQQANWPTATVPSLRVTILASAQWGAAWRSASTVGASPPSSMAQQSLQDVQRIFI